VKLGNDTITRDKTRSLCVKTPSKRRTDGQTPGIKFGASVTYGGNNFNEFPDK